MVEGAELGGFRYEITKEQWTALQSRGQPAGAAARVSPRPARCLPACCGRRRRERPDRPGAAPSRRRVRPAGGVLCAIWTRMTRAVAAITGQRRSAAGGLPRRRRAGASLSAPAAGGTTSRNWSTSTWS